MTRHEKQNSREPTPRQQEVSPGGDGGFRRNPRKRKRPGLVPFANLMIEAKLPRRFERAALSVVGRFGYTVLDFAAGILAVPEDEVEEQLDLLRTLSMYEQMRGCDIEAGLDFSRNPTEQKRVSKDTCPDGAEEVEEEDEEEEEDDDDERAY